MEGVVTAANPGTPSITVAMDLSLGAGTLSAWSLSIGRGQPSSVVGPTGPAGATGGVGGTGAAGPTGPTGPAGAGSPGTAAPLPVRSAAVVGTALLFSREDHVHVGDSLDTAQTVTATKTFAPATDIKPLRVLRGSDSSPTARLLEFRNHADNADLLYIDQNGNLAGNVVSGLSGSFFTSAAGGSAPTTAKRWVGGMAGLGAPTSGTWGAGDWVVDDYGNVWICTAAGTPGTWITPAQYLRGTNMLHNGEFMVCQRGTSGVGSTALPSTAGGRSGPDRWAVWRTGYAAGATWAQVAGPLNVSAYAARVGRVAANAATTGILFGQAMLTADSEDLVSQASTISFYASAGANYSSAGSILGVTVTTGTGTDEAVDAGYTGSVTLLSTSVTLTTSWQKFTVAVPAPATSATELKVTFSYNPVGTAGAADYFNITAVQWEPGADRARLRPDGLRQRAAPLPVLLPADQLADQRHDRQRHAVHHHRDLCRAADPDHAGDPGDRAEQHHHRDHDVLRWRQPGQYGDHTRCRRRAVRTRSSSPSPLLP